MVYDEIMYHGGSIKDFPIPSSLLLACQSAHMKYKNDLDRKKAESEKTEITNKRKLLTDKLNIEKNPSQERKIQVTKLLEVTQKYNIFCFHKFFKQFS